jgi:ubiquinone/menaquinone biosynthesis C-methylase UbiE
MPKKIPPSGTRTFEQIREHYEIEKELADRLRNSTEEERMSLYTSVYDTLFQKVPHHPQLTRKEESSSRRIYVSKQLQFLQRFLNPNSTFLEVGPGDCSLTIEVSKQVRKAYAIDVSKVVTLNQELPENFELIISDGRSIPVPMDSIDVIYSNQLMEHLHPDDAFKQLHNIYQVLNKGGVYVCITPNQLNGPHDISEFFDDIATGFHLKEYTITELSELFKKVGFSQISPYIGVRKTYVKVPLFIMKISEAFLSKIPYGLRMRMISNLLFDVFLQIKIVGTK